MSTAADAPTMKVMFVRGPAAETDGATLQQLRAVAPELDVTTAQGAAEAIAEIRKANAWGALLVSPSLPHNETLALITTLRRDRVAMAIVPVVDEAQQDLFAAAVASGADDILLRRGQTLMNVAETVTRMRQSPHLFPVDERRRLGVIYAGRDPLVWSLLEQVPFIRAERAAIAADGACPVRPAGTADPGQRTDAVVIDEQPGEAHPLQVLKSVKAQASDLPVVMLTSSVTSDVATAALELGADDTVLKTGIFRRRLIAALRRVHQRLELTMQQAEMRAREERLRQIVENVPTGITVISVDGVVLAMNASALGLFAAKKPRDVVGRDFRQFVAPDDRESVTQFLRQVTAGESAAANFRVHRLDGGDGVLTIRGVVLERDAKGSRGVIASLARAAAAAESAPAEGVADRAELTSALEALRRLQDQRAELTETRTREQAAWADERARLEAAVAAAAERSAAASDRLGEMTSELGRAGDTFAIERGELEARIAALEGTQASAAAAEASRAADLQFNLEAAVAEARQAITEHESALARWDAERAELEARIQDLERGAVAARADEGVLMERDALLAERDRLRAERDAEDEARTRLEDDLRGAREALWIEHSERDTLRAGFDQELSELRRILTAEREAWIAERAELESRAETLRTEAETRLGVMADEHAQAAQAARQHREHEAAAVREERETLRQALAEHEARLAAAAADHARAIETERSARQADGSALDDARRALEAADDRLRALAEAHAHELAAEREARRQQAAEIEELRQALTAAEGRAQAGADDRTKEIDAERERRVASEAALEQARQTIADVEARAQAEAERHARALADAQAAALRDGAAVGEAERAANEARRAVDEMRAAHERALSSERDLRQADAAALDNARRAWIDVEATLRAEAAGARQAAAAARDEQQARAVDLERRILDEDARRSTEHEAAIRSLESERDEALKSLADLRQERSQLEARFADDLERAEETTRATAEEYDATRARLEAERDDLARRLADAETATANLRTEIERVTHDRHERETAARLAAEQQIAGLESELARVRGEAHRVDGLLATTADLDRQLAETRAALDAHRSQSEQDRATFDADRRQWDSDRDTWAATAAALRSQIESFGAERGAWQAERQRLEAAAHDLATERDQQRHDRDAERRSWDEERASVAARAEAWSAERTAWHAEREALEAARQAVEQAAAARTDAHRTLEAELRQAVEHRDRLERDREAERAAWQAERDDLQAVWGSERDAWTQERGSLADELARHARAAAERVALDQSLQVLRSDYAAMVLALEGERAARERDRARQADLEQVLAQARDRHAALERELTETTNEAEALIRRREAQHAGAMQALERELTQNAIRLSRMAEEADRARAALHAEFTRAAEGHHRLIASDLFGYAVTTLAGELVRCNDAFARLFGFADAPDAMTRTAGRTIPGLADRPALVARLEADGHVSRLEACLERADGQPIRVAQSATLLSDPADVDSETLVEHVLLGAPAAADSTELRAQRLEAVGSLTSEMVPDLEALVTSLHEQIGDADRDRRSVMLLAGQVAALIRQLGAFSRRQLLPTGRVDLSQVVVAAEPTLLRLVGDYIAFSTDLEETGGVAAHVDDLDQLLTSLVTLGRDLLPAGGSIVVETRRQASASDRQPGTEDSDGPLLSVNASGYGVQMPDRSTALVQVVERAGGQLRIHGEPGWLARLDVTFPRCGRSRSRKTWID